MLSKNLDTWHGKQVVDWTAESTEPLTGDKAYRIRLDWEPEEAWVDVFATFLAQPNVSEATAFIVGSWGDPMEGNEALNALVEAIAGAHEKLPSLTALFIGDITYEECEISWITQTDLSPLLAAYPKLEHFGARGGQQLSLGVPKHDHLKSLVVETGGLPVSVIQEVSDAELPALEHLELYLGSTNYGATSSVTDLETILQKGREKWPNLTYLGLRDCEYADELAAALAQDGGVPVLNQLQTLDLSLGTLGNDGVQALAACPAISKLKKLDIHHHYASPENVALLTALDIEVDASEAEEEDKYGRYVAVGE